jgi:DNA polymerase-3 subunit alpha
MAFADFVHLRTHSAFSLAEGAIKVKDLIDLCYKKRMPAVALTDSANLFGAMEFSLAAVKKGIQPIIGCTLWVAYDEDDPRLKEGPLVAKNDFDTLILLAKSKTGYQNLMKLISKAYIKYHANPLPYVTFQDLQEHTQDLIVLSGGLQGGISKLLLKKQGEAAEQYLQKLHFIKIISTSNFQGVVCGKSKRLKNL